MWHVKEVDQKQQRDAESHAFCIEELFRDLWTSFRVSECTSYFGSAAFQGQRDAYEKLDLCVQIRHGSAGHLISQRLTLHSVVLFCVAVCNMFLYLKCSLDDLGRMCGSGNSSAHQFVFGFRAGFLFRMLDIALGICNDAPTKQLGVLALQQINH